MGRFERIQETSIRSRSSIIKRSQLSLGEEASLDSRTSFFDLPTMSPPDSTSLSQLLPRCLLLLHETLHIFYRSPRCRPIIPLNRKRALDRQPSKSNVLRLPPSLRSGRLDERYHLQGSRTEGIVGSEGET